MISNPSDSKVIAQDNFSERKSTCKVKVTRSNMKVQCASSYHKKYTCEHSPSSVQMLWPRLKFSISRSNFKVKVIKSKILVPMERFCHKECIYEI